LIANFWLVLFSKDTPFDREFAALNQIKRYFQLTDFLNTTLIPSADT